MRTEQFHSRQQLIFQQKHRRAFEWKMKNCCFVSQMVEIKKNFLGIWFKNLYEKAKLPASVILTAFADRTRNITDILKIFKHSHLRLCVDRNFSEWSLFTLPNRITEFHIEANFMEKKNYSFKWPASFSSQRKYQSEKFDSNSHESQVCMLFIQNIPHLIRVLMNENSWNRIGFSYGVGWKSTPELVKQKISIYLQVLSIRAPYVNENPISLSHMRAVHV